MAITDKILQVGGTTEAAFKSYLGGDNHVNAEPVRDDNKDFDANDHNRIVKLASEMAKRLRPGNLIKIGCELATTSGTASANIPLIGSTNPYDILFKDGRLVGITAWFDSAMTAGTADIYCYKAATTLSTLKVSLSSGLQSGIARQLPEDAAASETFDASAINLINARIVTSGATWAGASKLHVNLFISIGEEEDI